MKIAACSVALSLLLLAGMQHCDASETGKSKWLQHGALAYTHWREGNSVGAQMEAETAVKLAPNNASALTLLAGILEAQDDCAGALPLYERACKTAKTCDAWLGQIRCNSKLGHPGEALAVLQLMHQMPQRDFDWNLRLAEMSIQLEQFALAERAAVRALESAQTAQQKSDSSEQRMLALLLGGRVDEARKFQHPFFTEHQPKDGEVYVRAASALVSDKDLNGGKEILESALKNLNDREDCDAFYRLGRVFQRNGTAALLDAGLAAAWMKNAESAFSKALQLNPYMSTYHVALAGVFSFQKKFDMVHTELQSAIKLEGSDKLAKFLDEQCTAGVQNLKLTRAEFLVQGLNCSCHVGKLAAAMREMPGVEFVDITPQEPYRACILIDETITPLDKVLAVSKQKAFEGMKESFANISFGSTRRSSCSTIAGAIAVAQQAEQSDMVRFMRQFAGVEPVMPEEARALVSSKL